jgi:WD40 repeat protein
MLSDELILWDTIRNHEINRVKLDYGVNQSDYPLAFSQDGKAILFPTPESLIVLDGLTGENVRRLTAPVVDGKQSRLSLGAILPTGNKAALLFDFATGQTVGFYDTTTWESDGALFTLTGLRVPSYQHDMAISRDGQHLALLKTAYTQVPVKNDPTHKQTFPQRMSQLVIWDLIGKCAAAPIEIDNEHWTSSWASMVRFSPDGHFLAIGMANEDPEPIRIMDAATGQVVRAYKSPKGKGGWPVWGWLHGMDWSSDGQFIAFCGDDKAVHLLDAHTDQEIDSVTTPGSCAAVAFSPDSGRLAYGADNTVIIRRIHAIAAKD